LQPNLVVLSLVRDISRSIAKRRVSGEWGRDRGRRVDARNGLYGSGNHRKKQKYIRFNANHANDRGTEKV